jgi:hypothetical protein
MHLTHFKLYARHGVPDSIILDVLNALRSAPLEVLVLEGIAQGSLATVDRIAEHFPNLLGLTLMRREDERQHENKLATLPHFSWQYASRFSAFRRLQHFGWNFQINDLECTPCSVIACKEGLFAYTSTFEGVYNVEESTRDNHDCLALPFATYCPTLQTFVIICHSKPPEARRISRRSNGATKIERPTESPFAWNPWNILDKWNLFHWTLGWPTIIPPN